MFHVFHVFNKEGHPRVVPYLPATLQPDCYLWTGKQVIDWVLHWLAWFERHPESDFLCVSLWSSTYDIAVDSQDFNFWETLYKIEEDNL